MNICRYLADYQGANKRSGRADPYEGKPCCGRRFRRRLLVGLEPAPDGERLTALQPRTQSTAVIIKSVILCRAKSNSHVTVFGTN